MGTRSRVSCGGVSSLLSCRVVWLLHLLNPRVSLKTRRWRRVVSASLGRRRRRRESSLITRGLISGDVHDVSLPSSLDTRRIYVGVLPRSRVTPKFSSSSLCSGFDVASGCCVHFDFAGYSLRNNDLLVIVLLELPRNRK